MSIRIEQEPQELHCQFENCVLCDKPTGWWHVKSNRPVCPLCALINNEEDILKAKYNY